MKLVLRVVSLLNIAIKVRRKQPLEVLQRLCEVCTLFPLFIADSDDIVNRAYVP